LNEALLATAAEHKVLRTHRVRADTTVVAANVCYPTDVGLLAERSASFRPRSGRIRAAGAATRTTTRDRAERPTAASIKSPRRCGRAASRPSRWCCALP
jgi:transposase, IS5 family